MTNIGGSNSTVYRFPLQRTCPLSIWESGRVPLCLAFELFGGIVWEPPRYRAVRVKLSVGMRCVKPNFRGLRLKVMRSRISEEIFRGKILYPEHTSLQLFASSFWHEIFEFIFLAPCTEFSRFSPNFWVNLEQSGGRGGGGVVTSFSTEVHQS